MSYRERSKYRMPCVESAFLQIVSALISLVALTALASFVVEYTEIRRMKELSQHEIKNPTQIYLHTINEEKMQGRTNGNILKAGELVIFMGAFKAVKVLFWISLVVYFIYSLVELIVCIQTLRNLTKSASVIRALKWTKIWTSMNVFSLLLNLFCFGAILLFTNLEVTLSGALLLLLLRVTYVILGCLIVRDLKREAEEIDGSSVKENEPNEINTSGVGIEMNVVENWSNLG